MRPVLWSMKSTQDTKESPNSFCAFLWLTFAALAYSAGNKLDRVDYSLRFRESLDPLPRALRVVLLRERRGYCIANARATDQFGTNRNFEIAGLNRPTRLLPKSAKPSGRLVVPRAREYSSINDDGPDARVAVFSAGAHTQNLRPVKRLDYSICKRGFVRHVWTGVRDPTAGNLPYSIAGSARH